VHYLITSSLSPFYYVIWVYNYFEFASLFYSRIVVVVVHEPIVLLIVLISRLGYKFNKHLIN